MRHIQAFILLLVTAVSATADDVDPMAEYAWLQRPLVVFADTADDPRYLRQIELLEKDPGALLERDIVVLADTDPAAKSPLRQKLHPRDFMLVMIDKDGSIIFRKPTPWSVREISRAVDKTPIRQDEINEKLGK